MIMGNRSNPVRGKPGASRILSWAGYLAGLLFLALALWFFGRTLHQYEMAEVVSGFKRIPASSLALALACVALSYAVQTLYDFFGARSVGLGISPLRARLACFIGNTFTNNMGFSLLTGSSLRYRFYAAWGHSILDVAQVIALSKLAFFNGLFVFAGLAQILAPVRLPDSMNLPVTPRVLGGLVLAVPIAFLLWKVFSRGNTLKIGKISTMLPRQSMLFLQILVSYAHLAFAAGTFFYLHPADDLAAAGYRGPMTFLGTFMAIKFLALFFPVPGSLGVFEGMAMALLTPALPAYPVLGALLAFRLVYYVLPFALALLILIGFELSSRKGLLAVVVRRRR